MWLFFTIYLKMRYPIFFCAAFIFLQCSHDSSKNTPIPAANSNPVPTLQESGSNGDNNSAASIQSLKDTRQSLSEQVTKTSAVLENTMKAHPDKTARLAEMQEMLNSYQKKLKFLEEVIKDLENQSQETAAAGLLERLESEKKSLDEYKKSIAEIETQINQLR